MGPELVEIDAVPIEDKDTEKAWLVEAAVRGRKDKVEVWIPKSLSLWEEDSHTFSVADWFAEREGLI